MNLAHRLLFASVAAVATIFSGCSGSNIPDLAQVNGVVTLNGMPYPNAQVTFTPAQGRPSEGVTDAEGKFELVYLPQVKGAQLGDHTVAITTRYQAPENPGTERPFVEPLPPQYNVQSKLTAAVNSGVNVVDFPLTTR
ncbi:carboxypeptidase regulatory-like domain-containing protein [Anatilimnocola floriformis]|uniref:carboxypeptidase regulatory-like domain-containing protein n=1 Tax=Anatilimnocola floriformis TaxID=2948575 RepID=UPI0020C37F65|nr:carboxypeptidase regulatory-like domain-containing protein [Anatilimnocola floriformis]